MIITNMLEALIKHSIGMIINDKKYYHYDHH